MAENVPDPLSMEVSDAQPSAMPLDDSQSASIPAPQIPPDQPDNALPPPVTQPEIIAQPQAPIPATAPAPRTATPSRAVNGSVENSAPMPAKAAPHGAPARRYLNEKVTGVLLEGMKRLAAEQPDMPLKVLGEYLLQRSAEIEGKLT